MLDDKMFQARIVDSVESLSANQRLEWQEKSKDSYRSKVSGLQIDIDKSAVGENVVYVLWAWEANGNLAGRIDGRDLSISSVGVTKNYPEILKKIFISAQKSVKISALQRVADALDVARVSNTADDANE
jgi:hypothetical protein